MTREEIKQGLQFTIDMFLFEPTTGETLTEPRNDMDKTTIDACRGAIKLLEAWDKVIKEIEGQRDFNIECDGESDLGMAIQIIKKHLGEVEE